jgi:hypothetical protein
MKGLLFSLILWAIKERIIFKMEDIKVFKNKVFKFSKDKFNVIKQQFKKMNVDQLFKKNSAMSKVLNIVKTGFIRIKKFVVKNRLEIISAMVPIVIGGLLGVIIAKTGLFNWSGLSTWQWMFLLLVTVVNFYLQTILHELGYLIGGYLGKLDIQYFKLGPWRFELSKNKWSVVREKNKTIFPISLILPKKTSNMDKQFVFYYSSGILIHVICSFVAFIIYIMVNSNFAKAFFGIGWMVPLVLFMMHAIPFKRNGFKTDGANVLSFIRKSPKDLAENKVLFTTIDLIKGVKPGKLNANLLQEDMLLSDQDPLGITMNTYRFYNCLENGQLEEAKIYIDKVEENITYYPYELREEALYNVFYGYCFLKVDLEKAKAIYENMKKRVSEDKSIAKYRVKMAYELYINEDPECAIAFGKKGLGLQKEARIKGEGFFEASQIKKMTQEAKNLWNERKRSNGTY